MAVVNTLVMVPPPAQQDESRAPCLLVDCWRRTAHASRLKVTVGFRDLWPYLAAMYLTLCFAENLLEMVLMWPETQTDAWIWVVWVALEPCAVGFILFMALRVPRHSIWADLIFMVGVFADLVIGLILHAFIKEVQDGHRVWTNLDMNLLWFYTVVSLFVFAGFHMVAILSFWIATVVLTMCHGKLFRDNHRIESAEVMAVCIGGAITIIASLIESQITKSSERSERHRNAERVLLEFATDGSCVVEARTGKLIEISSDLEHVFGSAINDGLRLQDFITLSDQGRANALLEEASTGSLGSAVVTLQLSNVAIRSAPVACRLQDARVIAYSTSRKRIKICLQLLGEVRPVIGEYITPLPSFAEREHVEDFFIDGQLSPSASQARSGSQVTVRQNGAGLPADVLTTAFTRLPAGHGPSSSADSDCTAQLPWADATHTGTRGRLASSGTLRVGSPETELSRPVGQGGIDTHADHLDSENRPDSGLFVARDQGVVANGERTSSTTLTDALLPFYDSMLDGQMNAWGREESSSTL